MGKKDPRIDQYIAKSADFAKPVLTHLRALVHAAVPDVEEELKWSSPSFMYKGILCGFAAFKEHCTFGFWKHDLVMDGEPRGDAMGSFGRLTSLDDLPSDRVLANLIKKAARLNDEGVTVARKRTGPAKAMKVPQDFSSALKKNKRAATVFDAFSTSKKNDYVEWITECKTDATRQKRMTTALEWIAQGKSRNWKYEKPSG
jgi:uncharacterized protein YdeI (YjbR/CyaY-like superfamily)